MEETYTQAIDIRQYKRSGTHLNLLVVSKKEGLSEKRFFPASSPESFCWRFTALWHGSVPQPAPDSALLKMAPGP